MISPLLFGFSVGNLVWLQTGKRIIPPFIPLKFSDRNVQQLQDEGNAVKYLRNFEESCQVIKIK